MTSSTGFERTFERHLAAQQRKAVLEALASKIDHDATVGDVLDAAAALGWSDPMGELSLADLADALLTDGAATEREASREAAGDADVAEADGIEASDEASDEEDTDEEDPEEEEEVEEAAPSRARSTKKKTKQRASTKTSKAGGKAAKAGAKKKTKKTAKSTPTKAVKDKSTKAKATASKRSSTARLRALRKKIDADEPMSLDEAAEVFLPIIEQFDNATMQDLEETTGIGRRKLRFHIGQLVRHDYLERHGMGRGTYYTISR